MAHQVFTFSTSNPFMVTVHGYYIFPDLTKVILAAIITIVLHWGTINQHKPDHRLFKLKNYIHPSINTQTHTNFIKALCKKSSLLKLNDPNPKTAAPVSPMFLERRKVFHLFSLCKRVWHV